MWPEVEVKVETAVASDASWLSTANEPWEIDAGDAAAAVMAKQFGRMRRWTSAVAGAAAGADAS